MNKDSQQHGGASLPASDGSVAFHVNYYSAGVRTHGYDERWDKLQIHCPNCGKKEVWVRDDGDYYDGPEHLCANCGHNFYIPSGPNDASNDEQGKQRLAGIRAKPQNAQAQASPPETK